MTDNTDHRMDWAPRAVYDTEGERLGYVTTCTCGLGLFAAGSLPAKDTCWTLLAQHMVVANPDLRALVEKQ